MGTLRVVVQGQLISGQHNGCSRGPWQRPCCLLISLRTKLSYEELGNNVLIYRKVNGRDEVILPKLKSDSCVYSLTHNTILCYIRGDERNEDPN